MLALLASVPRTVQYPPRDEGYMFDALARPSGGRIRYSESPEVFADMARRIVALGFSEIGVYYPVLEEQLPIFEAIARDVLPELRSASQPAGMG